MAHPCHHPGHVCDGGHQGELHDAFPGHIIGDGGALADELAGGVGVVGHAHDGHPHFPGNALDGAAHLGPVADDQQRGFLFNGAQLALVAVGQDDDVPLFHHRFQHLAGGGADVDPPGGAHRILVAHHHLAPQGAEDVAVAGAALGQDAGVKYVHVGGGDVLDRDQSLQRAVGIHHRQGVDLLVPHHLPGRPQADAAGHAGGLPVVHIPDLGVDIGTHPGRCDAELFQHELALLVHPPGPAGLADQIAGQIFQLRIGNGGTDGVGVWVAVADHHHFMGSFWHRGGPPFYSGPPGPQLRFFSHLRCTGPAPARRGMVLFYHIRHTG